MTDKDIVEKVGELAVQNDPKDLKGRALCEYVYGMLYKRIMDGEFYGWGDVNDISRKGSEWMYKKFRPWMLREHPDVYKKIQEMIEAMADYEIVKKNKLKLSELMGTRITPGMIAEYFKQELDTQIKEGVSEKVKKMMSLMEDEVVKTKELALTGSMLAVVQYVNTINEKIQLGIPISAMEFKAAYEIFKTEIGEPTKIKETRTKNLSVNLSLPITEQEAQRILANNSGNNSNIDLSIEVAPEFKGKLNDRFNKLIQDQNDGHKGHPKDGGDTRVTT